MLTHDGSFPAHARLERGENPRKILRMNVVHVITRYGENIDGIQLIMLTSQYIKTAMPNFKLKAQSTSSCCCYYALA